MSVLRRTLPLSLFAIASLAPHLVAAQGRGTGTLGPDVQPGRTYAPAEPGRVPDSERNGQHPYGSLGGALVAISGGFTLITVGIVGLSAMSPDQTMIYSSLIPVAGPWVSMGLLGQRPGDHTLAYVLLGLDGVMQALGTTLVLYETHRSYGIGQRASAARVAVAPWVTFGGAGLALGIVAF